MNTTQYTSSFKNYNSISRTVSFSSSCHSTDQDDNDNEQTPLLRSRSGHSNSVTEETQEEDWKQENDSLSSYGYFWTYLLEQQSLSVYLDNKGSVARDHLANERTYLAWLRTSLSLISVGVGLTQLFRLDKTPSTHYPKDEFEALLKSGRLVGLMFILLGIFFVLFAVSRFFHSQQAMIKGYFPASRGIVLLSSCLVAIAVIILFIIIIQ
ncbi:uncharacterized protein BX664DRAFT_285118 [Halteromyces radiatus]|uniref:uncharacterized protein n=1 Tax=Halteromyces radiatus TaxID=101107 RepID=UPI00221EC5F0|nr:uncharacterized protein BX664DRAFT_285118 [Halteromyces radiatus]KAI8083155.1 hypothetical protein BX664DRAFT_285118 [Halteromyces radiatus]